MLRKAIACVLLATSAQAQEFIHIDEGFALDTRTLEIVESQSMASPLIEVGTYTGTRRNGVEGDTHRVSTAFVPDMVIVLPGNSQPAVWRNRTCWHGKTQFFHSQSSAIQIGPYAGNVHEPFRGRGFSVTGAANPASTTCYYIAIKDNGSGFMQSMSYVGNEVVGRAIDFLTSQPDAVFVKRDGGFVGGINRPAIFRDTTGSANVWGGFQQGAAERISSITSTGITVSGDEQVNENDGGGLGEGHEVVAFYEGSYFNVVEYTGDGTSSQAVDLGVAAAACIVFDTVNDATGDTEQHAFVTADMSANNSKPFNGALDTGGKIQGISGSTLTVGSDYNVSGRTYRVWAWVENSGTEVSENPRQPASPKSVKLTRGSGRIELPNNTVGNGASTIEWYGRPLLPEGTLYDGVTALFTSGGGSDGTPPVAHADEFNFGLYLSAYVDPDSNDWRGFVLRFMQGDYWSTQRTSANICTYNANTGIVIVPGQDVHFLLTHDGSGKYRLYMDGKLAKEYSIAGSHSTTYGSRSVGGTGTSLPTIVGAFSDGGGTPVYSEQGPTVVHRAAVWNDTALTDAQALSRYRHAFRRESYSGPAPDVEFDAVSGNTPGDVTITNGSYIDWINGGNNDQFVWTDAVEASGVNVTSFTASGAIPSAGRYVVGVVTVGTSTEVEVNSLTVGGDSQTLGSVRVGFDESGNVGGSGRYFRTDWFVVDPGASGDVVCGFDGTALFAGVGVWGVADDTVIAGDTAMGSGASVDTVTATIASGLDTDPLLCVLGAFTGASSITKGPEFQGMAFPYDFDAVGSSSRIYGGEGRASSQDAATVRSEHDVSSNQAIGLLAITQDNTQTMEIWQPSMSGAIPFIVRRRR